MERTIAVKGTGRVSVPPDQVEIPITLSAADPDYEKTMERGAEQQAALKAALLPLGFAAEDLKTVSFQVNTHYENQEDERGRWQQVFVGYLCTQECRIRFDLDTGFLASVVSALAGCSAHPDFHIRFTVKDPEVVKAALLRDAAENARQKAEILCDAAGVGLGELRHVNYSWNGANLYSASNVMLEEAPAMAKRAVALDFQPEDVRAEDSVTFIWNIL